MNFKEVQELIKIINRSNLTEFKMKDGEFELSIRTNKYQKTKGQDQKQPPAASVVPIQPASVSVQHPYAVSQTPPPPEAASQPQSAEPAREKESDKEKEEEKQYLEVKSPMVGTFYRSSSPDKPPFVKVGDRIEKGDVVCIVEAMKLFNEIESEISGTVVKVMVEDAQPVEYDQVLLLLEP